MIARDRSDVVIVGGVAAGPKTGAVLARRNPSLSIVLFQKDHYISYGSCGLPYFASGEVSVFSSLTKTSYGVERTPEFFRNTKGFDVVTDAEVIAINPDNKTVTVKSCKDESIHVHGYSNLVIATGARPKVPPFPVPQSPVVRYFTKPEDAIDFRRLSEKGRIGSLAIVGGGYIGCEMAEAATVWGFDTTLIEREPQVLPGGFDPEMALHAQRELERNGIRVLTGAAVKEITLRNEKPVIQVDTAGEIEVDYVILSLGVVPESELARRCGLALGEREGILVDEKMRTSDPAIYAGGDCVEQINGITGKRSFLPLGSLANRHGRVIAENIAGGAAVFRGVLGAALVKVCDKNMGCVGLTEKAARNEGISVQCVWGGFGDRPDYYPDAKGMVLKMVYDGTSGRLLGLQAAGEGDILRRIDVFSAMLRRNGVVDDLIDLEHGYAPPYSEAMDPLHHLASMAQAKKRGLSMLPPCSASSGYPGLMGAAGMVWLDVRENHQFSETKIPQYGSEKVIQIPLNMLRGRLGELDRDCEYVIMCGYGARAYQAWSILCNAGFKKIHVAGAGIAGAAL